MLNTIAAILCILWLLAVITGRSPTVAVHALPALAVVLVAWSFWRQRKRP